jgi:omega-6 fatty acid desaturase (delta-12 desaturase)
MTAKRRQNSRQPSIVAVKREIRIADVTRSNAAAVAIAALDTLLYASAVLGVLWVAWWPARLVFSIVAGFMIVVLFIVAHDACHGSLASSARVNSIIARICFLPALFPYSSWQRGHNHLHHGWTNLSERDYGWRPLALAEYQALPPWRRTLERVYRSTPGVALYAIIEIWWLRMMRIADEDYRFLDLLTSRIDRGLVFAYAGFAVAVISPFGLSALLMVLVVPLLVFHWLFGYVTFQQHTHPRSRWFKTLEEWSFYEGQVVNTVHIVFPRIVELMLHNITFHGAHHVDPKVPLYKLVGAQVNLEQAFGAEMIVERWSLSSHRRLFRTCRLYDYEHHRWLDFDGTPTTS